MKDIFSPKVTREVIDRINKLSIETQPLWGKMNVGQMLAHCNVVYEMIYDDIHPKPNAFKKFIIKLIAKEAVVGPKPYKKNSPTAPQFKVSADKDFETEKNRLIVYLNRTQELGRDHFDNKESHSFGPLTADEWNTLFYKHIDHHLAQFGV